MKNIHVLPTDKPSRVYEFGGQYFIQEKHQENFRSYNIYITSDEEIKEGDWFLNTLNNKLDKCYDLIYKKNVNLSNWCEKIILTDNKDLIKDGVQAVDDDFLEWFVKNTSCERVELSLEETQYGSGIYEYVIYKKEIPKEEPKQDWFCPKCDSYVSSESVTFEETHQICNTGVVIKKPKQETLTNDTDSHSWGFENFEVIKTEEDAEIFVETMENIPEPNDKLKKAFRDFNKQETLEKYSERFNNKENEVVDGIFNPENWGRRVVKQETLEEARVNNLIKLFGKDYDLEPRCVIESCNDSLIYGAKWQQEQIYNLIKELYDNENITSFSKKAYAQCLYIVEQFKNK